MESKPLAIVIPAYKDEYLERAIASLAAQTNLNFTVYVGDDCSKYNIKAICDKYKNSIDIQYHRFETNLGGTDLVAQWERCVTLTKDEEWLWIFSDDDMTESKCVEAFYNALAETKGYYDVYRFNTCVIDQNDQFKHAANESPTVEDGVSLAYNILMEKRGNSMPEHIFKKSVYLGKGGVVNFIQAQASDWATAIKFAGNKGLYTISGPNVQWRHSGTNISSTAHAHKARLIFGHLQFIEWVISFFKADQYTDTIKSGDILTASRYNLESVIKWHYKGIPYSAVHSVAKKISYIYKESYFKSLRFCFKINYELLKVGIKNRIKQQYKQ